MYLQISIDHRMQKRTQIALQKCCDYFSIKIASYAGEFIKSQVEVCSNSIIIVVLETND
jgi:hypothetical protein